MVFKKYVLHQQFITTPLGIRQHIHNHYYHHHCEQLKKFHIMLSICWLMKTTCSSIYSGIKYWQMTVYDVKLVTIAEPFLVLPLYIILLGALFWNSRNGSSRFQTQQLTTVYRTIAFAKLFSQLLYQSIISSFTFTIGTFDSTCF